MAQDKWNLNPIFSTKELFDESLKNWEAQLNQVDITQYQGKLSDYSTFLQLFKLEEDLMTKAYTLYLYAHLDSDLNLKDQNKRQTIQYVWSLLDKMEQLFSFVYPELIKIGKKTIFSFLEKDEYLKQYKQSMIQLFDSQKHVLTAKEEKILSIFGGVTSSIKDIYTSLYTADHQNVKVTLQDGSEVEVKATNYSTLIADSTNPEDRAKIFSAQYAKFRLHKNTFASIYRAELEQYNNRRIAMGYKSILDSFLEPNQIPTKLFHSLIEVASTNTAPLKRHIALRKKILKLDEYHTYDRFIPIGKDKSSYTYNQGKQIFFDSIEHFPSYFKDVEKQALEEGYVDVFPQEGKRTGAYSSSIFGHHPYILLNHNNTLDSIGTIAHESGHSAHSLFSSANQPYATADYRIFVAEIASTFNEHNLFDYLYNKTEDKNEKIVLLENAISDISSTFYRQTLFAHYEYLVSLEIEKRTPINEQILSKIMIDLYQQYYGIDITKEDGKELVWAYIPHLFNSPFYVYQYATSFAASLKFYQKVKEGGQPELDNYLILLKSGGSDYPVNLVKKAGVDLTDKKSFLAVVDRMTYLLDELESLLDE